VVPAFCAGVVAYGKDFWKYRAQRSSVVWNGSYANDVASLPISSCTAAIST